jgi:HAMP domain-containing protein
MSDEKKPDHKKTGEKEGNPMAAQASVNSGDISAKIQAATEELNLLEKSIHTGTVDVRVLVEFREAMEHARRASSAVQKWVEEEAKKGGDPFSAVRFVAAERMRIATQMLGELARDVESGDLDFDTAGLGDLRAAVKTLNERLARFGK